MTLESLRFVFLFFLVVTGILFALRGGLGLGLSDLWRIILDFLLVPAALLTVTLFLMIIFRIDPQVLLIRGLDLISNRTVSFPSAVPLDLQEALSATIVQRHDTDGDNFNEWVVFYEYNLQPDVNPVQVTIYDNDRGIPPVVYPYNLIAPSRTYLGEDATRVSFTLENVTQDNNGPAETPDLPEILVQAGGRLSIFRYNPDNKRFISPADFPLDTPPRYEVIGFFNGTTVNLDVDTKNVTVQDRSPYERSQLALRSIYGLNPNVNLSSYWQAGLCSRDNFEGCILAEPLVETVDFFSEPPNDIYNVRYPEQIVLAFYATTCGAADDSLCRHAGRGWAQDQLLYPGSDAQGGGPSYFGLTSLSGTRQLEVSKLEYFPGAEGLYGVSTTNLDGSPTSQLPLVRVTFQTADQPFDQIIAFELQTTPAGQWKITRRVDDAGSISNALDTGN